MRANLDAWIVGRAVEEAHFQVHQRAADVLGAPLQRLDLLRDAVEELLREEKCNLNTTLSLKEQEM